MSAVIENIQVRHKSAPPDTRAAPRYPARACAWTLCVAVWPDATDTTVQAMRKRVNKRPAAHPAPGSRFTECRRCNRSFPTHTFHNGHPCTVALPPPLTQPVALSVQPPVSLASISFAWNESNPHVSINLVGEPGLPTLSLTLPQRSLTLDVLILLISKAKTCKGLRVGCYVAQPFLFIL